MENKLKVTKAKLQSKRNEIDGNAKTNLPRKMTVASEYIVKLSLLSASIKRHSNNAMF